MKFQRSRRGASRRNTNDAVGSICITVTRSGDKGRFHTLGNITRRLTVRSSKVSIVTKAIERALFGKETR